MVLIPKERRRSALTPPQPKREPMGRGHIFSGTSSGQRVWVLSGFSKSLAIFARSLLEEIPTFTVNFSLVRISSRMRCAVSSA